MLCVNVNKCCPIPRLRHRIPVCVCVCVVNAGVAGLVVSPPLDAARFSPRPACWQHTCHHPASLLLPPLLPPASSSSSCLLFLSSVLLTRVLLCVICLIGALSHVDDVIAATPVCVCSQKRNPQLQSRCSQSEPESSCSPGSASDSGSLTADCSWSFTSSVRVRLQLSGRFRHWPKTTTLGQ